MKIPLLKFTEEGIYCQKANDILFVSYGTLDLLRKKETKVQTH